MLSLRAAARRSIGASTSTPSSRLIHTQTVTDDDIARLAAQPLHALTLADLCQHGRPPLSPAALLRSAHFTLALLPARLAHRIQALRRLPYIVVANPHVHRIHAHYVHSLSTLLPYAEPREDGGADGGGSGRLVTSADELRFTDVMADLVRTHAHTIAVLAKGFLEARRYIRADEVTRFLDEHLRARIGTRLIAEQHIALHLSSVGQQHDPAAQDSFVGVIDTALRPAEIVRACEHTVGEICELQYGVRPTVDIVGAPDTTIAHVPMHLTYVLTELLKNAFRATIEAGMQRCPVEVTIAPAPVPPQSSPSSSAAAAHADIRPLETGSPGVTVRIRDRGGGVAPEALGRLWDYGFTTFNEEQVRDAGGSSLAGLGYGLPLGRAYAEYFGGGIAVQSLWGWGTDVYLSLRGVGRVDGVAAGKGVRW